MRKLFGLLLFLPSLLFAQATFKVADDSSSGTYHQMLNEVKEVCSTLDIEEGSNKGGALGNLEALANHEVDAAFMHSDVLLFNAQANPDYKQFQAIAVLYPEDIHVIALRESKTSKPGAFAFGKAQFNTFTDLAGFKVGAAGGGVLTLRLLQGQGQVHYDVVEFQSGSDVLNALKNGDIAAAVFVGGAPLNNVAQLPGSQFKLLSIGADVAGRVGNIYKPSIIKYTNLGGENVQTLAPTAIIATRRFSTPAKIAPQAEFRRCFYDHLAELQEGTGKHRKWSQVDPSNHGDNWYEIPGTGTATTRRR